MEVEVRVKAPWGNYGLFCGAIRRLWALGTLSSTGFHIPTHHLCHQCLLAHPVLEQFLTFCSIHTPSSFQAPQAVLHSPIILSLHRCLSRKKKKAFFQRCLFHDTGICLSLCTSSPPAGPRFQTLLRGEQEFTQSSVFASVSLLWFPSQRKSSILTLSRCLSTENSADSCGCLPGLPGPAHVLAPSEQSSPVFACPTWAPLWWASAGICLSSKISSLALGKISLMTCRIQHRMRGRN